MMSLSITTLSILPVMTNSNADLFVRFVPIRHALNIRQRKYLLVIGMTFYSNQRVRVVGSMIWLQIPL